MTAKMKALVYEQYGPPEVLQLKEVDKPRPARNQVLIKIHATTVTKYDCWMRSCTAPPRFSFFVRMTSGRKPKKPILGTELSGEIESVGLDVTRFKAGDAVFAYPGMNLGACAEYICLTENAAALIPVNATYEESAAVLQGGLTALFFLRKAKIQPGQEILIFGASGGVGSYAVQLARHYFGARVTGVWSSSKIGFVKSLGADHVIDYTHEDFTQNGQHYDIVFDTVGKTSISRSKNSLKKRGSYIFATFSLLMLFQILWLSRTSSLNLVYGSLQEKNEDLVFLKRVIEEDMLKPVVERCYLLEQTVEAHRYVESGNKTGSVVITI